MTLGTRTDLLSEQPHAHHHVTTTLPRIRSERPTIDVNHPEPLGYADHGTTEPQHAGDKVK